MTVIADAGLAARSLGDHPQDHGWRELYRLFAYGLDREAPELGDTVVTFRKARSESSFNHLLTLLGIAVKASDPQRFPALVDTGIRASDRLGILESILRDNDENIAGILLLRQNSFTSARRFLIVQVILGAYFGTAPRNSVNFADLGTGLGILPRQLNSLAIFESFNPDLHWDGRRAAFSPIPLARRFGVERGPRPDLGWVHACYGATEYYRNLYRELKLSLATPGVMDADVSFHEFDMLEGDALADFAGKQQISAVNLSYVLYEIDPERRGRIIEVLRESLASPKVVLVTEPVAELTRPGCTVTLYDESRPEPQRLCLVTDGHFQGDVLPLDDYASFVERHPIEFKP